MLMLRSKFLILCKYCQDEIKTNKLCLKTGKNELNYLNLVSSG
jgi:hypothetical protein